VSAPSAELVAACAEMLGRMGVGELRVGYTDPDDGEPVAWYAMAYFRVQGAWEAAGAMTPDRALYRLCEQVMDGGHCTHCGRPTGVVDDARAADMPANDQICWYALDPELKRFRRECEGR